VHKSLHGLIISEWSIDKGKFLWKFQIPANTTAKVSVPVQGDGVVEESGGPADKAAGVKSVGREGGYAVYEVGAGDYSSQQPGNRQQTYVLAGMGPAAPLNSKGSAGAWPDCEKPELNGQGRKS